MMLGPPCPAAPTSHAAPPPVGLHAKCCPYLSRSDDPRTARGCRRGRRTRSRFWPTDLRFAKRTSANGALCRYTPTQSSKSLVAISSPHGQAASTGPLVRPLSLPTVNYLLPSHPQSLN